jgi:hypothetical protein
MGLYDEVVAKSHPLLPAKCQGITFQSKSLGRGLERYELREDGILWHRVSTMVWESDPSRLLGGVAREASHKWLPKMDLDGEVEIHIGIRFSVTLVFLDGILVKVKENDAKHVD